MNLKLLKKLPSSLKRQAIGMVASALKDLLRASHQGQELKEGEEDFALLLYQTDKTDRESRLMATLVAVDEKAAVTRPVKTYVVDDLIKQLEKQL